MAELLDVSEPENCAVERAELFEDRRNIQRQAQVVMNDFRKSFTFPEFSFAFLFAPAIAQKVGCRAIEVGLAHRLYHVRSVDHADVSFLQDFVRGGGIVAQAAEVAVKKASRA